MYRVVVMNRGKYNNVMVGARYCFTKRSLVKLVADFMSMECDCEVERFVRICKDVFCWSEAEVSSAIWDRIDAALEKLTTKED
jgi:hypothetical protein